MHLSQIAQAIAESATLKLNATAAQLKRAGEPLIHLGGGEPVSLAPEGAVAAGEALFRSRAIRYAPASGLPELREGVVRYVARYYGHEIAANEVIISGGAKQALMVALQAIVDPGDEVVFAAPYWVSYPEMVKLAGGASVVVEASDGSFVPSFADFEAAVTPRTRALILNSPSNPTGMVYDKSLLQQLIALCEDRDIYLIMDDIYHRLIFEGAEATSCHALARKHHDESRLIVINGVSKAYAMTGYRVGWAVAAAPLIKAMGSIQGHQTSGPSPLNQLCALGALDGDQSSVDELCAQLQKNRDLLLGELSQLPGIEPTPPQGTFYCFVDFSHYQSDADALAALLLEKALVAAVPGGAFGRDGHLRLSTCGAADDLVEACRRIRWILSSDGPATLEVAGKTLSR